MSTLALAVTLALAAPADAGPGGEAKAAYGKGLKAVAQQDFAAAAKWFGEADRLSPNPMALTSALRAATTADDGPLAMELADRAAARDAPPAGTTTPPHVDFPAAARAARSKFAARTGKIRLRCQAGASCRGEVKGREVPPDQDVWLRVGDHVVVVSVGERVENVPVAVGPGKTHVVESTIGPDPVEPTPHPTTKPEPTAKAPPAQPPPAKPPPPVGSEPAPADGGGLSPAWFGVALGTTVVLGGITIGSAVDTINLHDEFEQTGQGADEGQDAETRTNVLIGVTAAAAVSVLFFGIFTDWSGSDLAPVAATVWPEGAQLVFNSSL